MKAKEHTQPLPQTPELHRNPMRGDGGPGAFPDELRGRFFEVLAEELSSHPRPDSASPWIIGFSHGADSSALLALLHEFGQAHDCPPLHPIHIDHGLREGSADEAVLAKIFCERLGLSCEIHRLGAGSGESWARRERYRIFRERALALGASRLCLAHHRDDDLETLLFRLQRGTGPLGLAGIPAGRPLDPSGRTAARIYRPLLSFDKSEIVSWLRERGLGWIEDPSNAELALTPRNRIRHELVPALRRSPRAWRALLALKDEAERFAECVQAELAALPVSLATQPGADLTLRTLPLRTLPLRPLQQLSPWAFERYLSLVLEAQGQVRPSRALLHQARSLLRERLPSGKCVEARGRWRLERRKMALHLRLLAP